MRVEILCSGSRGNSIYFGFSDFGILIDAGKPKKMLEKLMLEKGINPTTIKAICITHSHGDHIGGLSLANKYSIPVYATVGEWKGISGVNDRLQRSLETRYGIYEPTYLGGVTVHPFQTHHDAYEPVGYAVEPDDGPRACVVFDTGKVDDDMLAMMEGSIYIIEANHDRDMVAESSYPDSVKARVLSDLGHLSNEQTAAALAELISGRGEQIYLTHLSSSNNLPALAEATVKAALARRGFRAGKHYHLEVIV
ncbi:MULTISPECIES: MBL fold metallo-hydrolase [unclassified Paenibacillus]|uniref:MBL fold metallo-hydrolase n=1 Tax=unclassified Paenibacillus TaxID=185978 RepID=UPI0024074F07|nr:MULTISPECIES: MBL fold metallo-hydrolase [unclassified Paenibacillus]MDF9844181.1 phosphoribosyl 1,2-cyclic phosphodiesterase [Paenibacillus sp. PastF-2]MDF9850697.1 phosphoribosyl 1,2-cyclic phosphodiesterase [Paenibacillus sp. PastM-2]MDF9857268.1 phosphoribosyl 1,2-cyclic phosphodiesterase [Paenibacillus sp. PastF-1]MDH6482624.1 phosphoribosyl 1,2-cyclic phosphodiesterase [Paenibacillus sp. PastH-2]MDH6510051.1 phosphoribosyl 1,2-cyclic phosphodiesterase [Paenibacillus sp. PastM-3]